MDQLGFQFGLQEPPSTPDVTGDLVVIIPAGALIAIVSVVFWLYRKSKTKS